MKKIMSVLISMFLFPCLINAQWSSNTAENTLIRDTIGEQVLPKVAVNNESGESYISWYSELGSFQYNVYLQRLDVDGYKLWAEDGLLISSHPTMTWITDYDLVIDNDGCAILSIQDMRDGNSNVYVYRISPDGEFLWGDNGIALTNDDDFNPSPQATVDNDGNIVFAWGAENNDTTSFSEVFLQKVSADGELLWAENAIISNDTMHCLMPCFIPSEDNSTIAVWVETVTTDTACGAWPNMYPVAQKIDSDGNLAWSENVSIDNSDNMPLKFFSPSLVSDGSGGFFIGWMAFPNGQFYTSYVQHINADGVAQWTQNGVNVSDSSQFEHTNPTLCYLTQYDELFVFWNEYRGYNMANIQCAIFGQKFSNTGLPLWTNGGVVFDGWYSYYETYTAVCGINPATENDFMLFFENEYLEYSSDTIVVTTYLATRINHDGNFVWEDEKPVISSALSNKGNIVCSELYSNQWILTWSDNRNDPQFESETGVYAQNISFDGNTGPTGITDNQTRNGIHFSVIPNPFQNQITLNFEITQSGNVNADVLTIDGRLVKNIFNCYKQQGLHSILVETANLPKGIYLIKLRLNNSAVVRKIVKGY